SEMRSNLRHGIRHVLDLCMDTTEFDAVFRRSDEVNKSVFATMDKLGVLARSFFLFVNYMDTHTPYVPPAPYNRLFLGLDKPVNYVAHEIVQHETFDAMTMPAGVRESLIAQYDGGVAYQ